MRSLFGLGVNSSILLGQSAVLADTAFLRPTKFTNTQTFRSITVVPFDPGQLVFPPKFTNTQTFRSLLLSHVAAQALHPTKFTNTQTFRGVTLSVPLGDPHPYWRIEVTANNGAANVGIGKVEMYSGYNRLNQCRGGTPSASSEASGNTAAEAFDETYTNSGGTPRWVSTGATGWIQYHFGTAVNVTGVMLRNWFNQGAQMVAAFNVQWSDDGSAWTTAWSESGETSWGDWEGRWYWDPGYSPSYSGSPLTTFRYYRELCLLPGSGPTDWSIAEIEIRAAPSGADQATGGTAFASAASAEAASNAFDNNTATRWRTARGGANDPQSVGYDMGSGNGFKLAEIVIRSRDDSDAAAGQAPDRGVVQGSNDNTNWSSLWETKAGSPYTAASPTRTFTDPFYV